MVSVGFVAEEDASAAAVGVASSLGLSFLDLNMPLRAFFMVEKASGAVARQVRQTVGSEMRGRR